MQDALLLTICGPGFTLESSVDSNVGAQLLTEGGDVVIRQNCRVQCILALPWTEGGVRASEMVSVRDTFMALANTITCGPCIWPQFSGGPEYHSSCSWRSDRGQDDTLRIHPYLCMLQLPA